MFLTFPHLICAGSTGESLEIKKDVQCSDQVLDSGLKPKRPSGPPLEIKVDYRIHFAPG